MSNTQRAAEYQRLDLRFNNRECNLIKRAAAAASLDAKTFIKKVANEQHPDYTNPVNHIIYEAIESAVKRIPPSSMEESRS
jgi:hypothetical protein